jgi:hypothetical protein
MESSASPVQDEIAELIVKEGEDIDFRVVLVAYILADLGEFVLNFLFMTLTR